MRNVRFLILTACLTVAMAACGRDADVPGTARLLEPAGVPAGVPNRPAFELLIVDDVFDQTYPRDDQRDAFWQALWSNYAASRGLTGDAAEFAAHGIDDREFLQPQLPTLEELRQYRNVVWLNTGTGYNGTSALYLATSTTSLLWDYVSAGGNLWIVGQMDVAAMRRNTGAQANLSYPIQLETGREQSGDFAATALTLGNATVMNERGQEPAAWLFEAAPADGSPLPLLELDLTRFSPVLSQFTGIARVDVVDPSTLVDGRGGFLQRLYTNRTAGMWNPEVHPEPVTNDFDGGVVATRWQHDRGPNRSRVQWFGFPLYYMQDDQAQEVFNQTLDWFRNRNR